MWKAFLTRPSTCELADFALLLLGMSVNQAGLERNFSDLKIKKTRLRNRLKLARLEKMSKVRVVKNKTHCNYSLTHYQVGADIRASHKEARFVEDRGKRKNHDGAKVADILAVPRYADLLEEDANASDKEDGELRPQQRLVKTREGWRKEMAKWVQDEHACNNSDSDDEELGNAMYGHQRSKWLPRSLELLMLFGGRKEADIDEQLKRAHRR